MSDRVLRLPANTEGRDFVVGDIHGCFDSVIEAMKRVDFDQRKDRIISVGDLFDRGPGSQRTAKFLSHDWVYAVRGNHEDILLELYQDGEPHPASIEFAASHYGFGWWKETPEEIRQLIVAAVRKLPIAIELETSRGLVGIVHADVPKGMDWATFIAKIEAGDEKTCETALWGRDRLHSNDDFGVPGIGRIFVGHTPMRRLAQLGNIFAIDTAAVYGVLDVEHQGALSFVDVMTKTNTLKTLEPMGKVASVSDPSDTPFSAYMR